MRVSMAIVPENTENRMEIIDKITGKQYSIEEVTKNADGEVVSAKGVEILPEDSDKEPETIEITQDNDISFRVTQWAKDTRLPEGFTLEGGKLVKNGNPIEMGNIEVERIIKCFAGNNRYAGNITFATKNEDGTENIMTYTPSRDQFSTLATYVPGKAVLVDTTDTRLIYVYSNDKEVTEKDEDGKDVTNTYFDEAGVIVIVNGNCSVRSIDNAIDTEKVVMSADESHIYIPNKETKISADETIEADGYSVVRVSDHAEIEENLELPEGLKSITRNRANSEFGKDLFCGKGFIQAGHSAAYRVESSKLADLADEGYVYLVDASYENDTMKLVIATADRKFKTVTRKSTKDRGDIVTVD